MDNVYVWWMDRSVLVNGEKLSPRFDLRNHSPDGFNCNYGGSGPAQLALAILAHELGDIEAQRHYQAFKWKVIAKLPHDERWQLTSEQIREVIEELKC